MVDLATIRAALGELYVKRESSQALAAALGMRPIPNPSTWRRETAKPHNS